MILFRYYRHAYLDVFTRRPGEQTEKPRETKKQTPIVTKTDAPGAKVAHEPPSKKGEVAPDDFYY